MRATGWLALMCLAAACQPSRTAPHPGPRMNGYALADFGDFAHDWTFVTTRFRQDSYEQRFTWANALAMKTLSAGRTDYADGSMFAKVGFLVADDPAFTSSLVPSGTRRYQFMVRDKKRFADTNGWGYVIFNAVGELFPGDEAEASRACAACHQIVAERGHVFSQLMRLTPRLDSERKDPAPPSSALAVRFEERPVGRLSDAIARQLPSGTTSVSYLEGELRRHVFGGTLHEVRPMLLDAALKSGRPAVLVAEDEQRFTMAWRDPADAEPCPAAGVRMRYAYAEPVPPSFTPRPGHRETWLRVGTVCLEAAQQAP